LLQELILASGSQRTCDLRAERKCGQMLAESPKAKGAILNGKDESGNFRQSTEATAEVKTLSAMGISKDQSSKWQKLAAVPDKEFEEAITIPGSRPKNSANGLVPILGNNQSRSIYHLLKVPRHSVQLAASYQRGSFQTCPASYP
jgi:hypothetical protein